MSLCRRRAEMTSRPMRCAHVTRLPLSDDDGTQPTVRISSAQQRLNTSSSSSSQQRHDVTDMEVLPALHSAHRLGHVTGSDFARYGTLAAALQSHRFEGVDSPLSSSVALALLNAGSAGTPSNPAEYIETFRRRTVPAVDLLRLTDPLVGNRRNQADPVDNRFSNATNSDLSKFTAYWTSLLAGQSRDVASHRAVTPAITGSCLQKKSQQDQQQLDGPRRCLSPPHTPKLFRPYLDDAETSPGQDPGTDDSDHTPTTTTEAVPNGVSTDEHSGLGVGVAPPGSPSVTSISHASTRKYACDLCGRLFSRSNTLVTHRRIHTGEKPFACDQCGRSFRQPGNLTRHRLTHTAIRPFVCIVCHKAFNRASNLQTHLRVHVASRSAEK